MKLKSALNRLMLTIIIIFLGFVFWLGLENRELQENSFGIVFTKTSGWGEKVIDSNKLNWNFEKIIPNNYTLHVFTVKTISINFSQSGTLPSGNLYATFNSIDSTNFKYSYDFTGGLRLNKAYLPKLVAGGTFTMENFEVWQQNSINEIKNILRTYLNDKIISSETITINNASQEYIYQMYPYFNFDEFFVNLNSPDMLLYNSCRNRYLQNMEAQSSADEKYLIQSLKQQNEENFKLDLLKKYGELFTKYPIMIEYLKIDKGMVLDRATMDDFIAPQYQK